jgi:hypothetical protein
MLLYLANHTRPDISFAIAQCAQYNHLPKLQHEQVLEHIGQYLKGTMDKGLVLKPNSSHPLDIDCCVGADFARIYGYEQLFDPSSVQSWSGYVLCVSNCLCIWSSKLHHIIATSTTEAEYNALSDTMCKVVPLQMLLEFLVKTIGYDREVISNIKVTIHEDNAACFKLANLPPGQFTPRTKFYAVKVHWFRSLLSDKRCIVKIETRFQYFNQVVVDIFEDIRSQLCGW